MLCKVGSADGIGGRSVEWRRNERAREKDSAAIGSLKDDGGWVC